MFGHAHVTNRLLEAIKKGASSESAEVAAIPQGAAGRGSTLFVDFHSTKPIYPVTNCHLNAMVADTQKWEQSAAFLLYKSFFPAPRRPLDRPSFDLQNQRDEFALAMCVGLGKDRFQLIARRLP